jgi:hypothetical protein
LFWVEAAVAGTLDPRDVVAQIPPTDEPAGDRDLEDEPESDENPPLQEPPGTHPPDEPAAQTPKDSTGLPLGEKEPAEPETLRYVPPGERAAPASADTLGGGPLGQSQPEAKKGRGGLFGLTPIVVLFGLAVAHVFIVKAVKD